MPLNSSSKSVKPWLCPVVVFGTLLHGVTNATAKEWDIYLLGGQSNALGWNTSLSELPVELQGSQNGVMLFDGQANTWGDLAPGSGNVASAFGPEVTLGYTLAQAHPERNIAIFKYASGSTDLATDWDPNATTTNTYDDFLDTFNGAIDSLPIGDTYSVKGMAWMQGEKDTSTTSTASAYQTNLTNFISNIRSDLGVRTMPFVVGQLAYTTITTRPNWPVVQNAQANAAALDDYAYMVSTSDLGLASDGIHLSSESQQVFGQRLAAAFQGEVDQLQITNPGFETPSLSDGGINLNVVSGWVKSGGTIGTYNPNTNFYDNAQILDGNGGAIGTMDGENVLLMIGTEVSVEQTLAAQVMEGMLYTLTVAVGDRNNGGRPDFAGYRIELLGGDTVLATTGNVTNSLSDGTFTDVSLSYLAKADDTGALGIRLVSLNGSAGHSIDFDNVRITALPEPASGLLLGACLLLTNIRRRR